LIFFYTWNCAAGFFEIKGPNLVAIHVDREVDPVCASIAPSTWRGIPASWRVSAISGGTDNLSSDASPHIASDRSSAGNCSAACPIAEEARACAY
jgi:hypothetical protein